VIVPVIPPGEEVAVYDEIVAPPSDAGAVNETFAVVAPVAVATTEVGAPAGAAAAYGVIEFEELDEELIPAPLVAVIENVYAWP